MAPLARGGGGYRFTKRKHNKILWADENILYLDYHDYYMGIDIDQTIYLSLFNLYKF